TGGAKLAAGMADVVPPTELAVVANTGDDVEVYGAHVSPDPDLVTYWLAEVIDERGWGIEGDTWAVMDALEAAGRAPWFRLGDRDLALCLMRTERLAAGERLTSAHAAVVRGMGVQSAVLPMSDEPLRTHVRTPAGWRAFQEFMIVDGAKAPIEAVEFRGAEAARPTPEVLDAIARADAIVIGPSNPVISIGPILAVPGMRKALAEARAPVVAVSPFVGGRAVKGPTEAFMDHTGHSLTASGVAEAYAGVIDAIVADEPAEVPGVASLETPTLMDGREARRRLATATLELASSLARSHGA
ncbi:MAG: 2-phospho-L-lactate transferase, partial [Thermoleophilaceae bacterium]|nr:2-phospho-L-lactate transferase [Thermoleophilaceae bacterium]